ncbi:hypothetical protein BDP27DRAFT_1301450 [Rhodocollybia butyracea]|uniref:RRM domain-containing protein n=1 Tax=Rhodocollybia butyracea TaxID=206335 RepID=A0A9P5PF47_9AGAR|nr:hypothetical protein BDP27DRAFT_1301450 [Rhodocollybia butyracea]
MSALIYYADKKKFAIRYVKYRPLSPLVSLGLVNFTPFCLLTSFSAWQPQDGATPAPPSGGDMNVEDSGPYGGSYNNGNGQRRSSRSRSPGDRDRDRDRDRGDRGDRDRGRRESSQIDNNPGNNLHVSGLSTKCDDRELEAIFVKVGRVSKAQVVYDPHSRESRGFGFVTMETPEEADAAVTALNSTEFMGKTLTVAKARRGRARTPTPGKYYGPTKRRPRDRPYDPRPYDSRYSRDRGGDRGGGRYDEHRGGGRDDPRGGRDDYRGWFFFALSSSNMALTAQLLITQEEEAEAEEGEIEVTVETAIMIMIEAIVTEVVTDLVDLES